jgi:hypothetical protein
MCILCQIYFYKDLNTVELFFSQNLNILSKKSSFAESLTKTVGLLQKCFFSAKILYMCKTLLKMLQYFGSLIVIGTPKTKICQKKISVFCLTLEKNFYQQKSVDSVFAVPGENQM